MSLEQQLMGTFRLVSLETRRSDGTSVLPLGSSPLGMFIFDADGHFSVQLTNPDIGTGDGPPAYTAMFGSYVVDQIAQTFTLTPIGALPAGLIGTEVLRHVRFGDDVAVFNTPVQVVDGMETTTYITWRKVSGGAA